MAKAPPILAYTCFAEVYCVIRSEADLKQGTGDVIHMNQHLELAQKQILSQHLIQSMEILQMSTQESVHGKPGN